MLPSQFVESLKSFLSQDDVSALCGAIENSEPITSIRFNPFKIESPRSGRQIPWNRYGFILEGRPQFTLDPLFHAGTYYVQEASSMFVEHIYRSLTGTRKGIRLLDLCAAPGGKTTLYSSIVGSDGLVIANEVIRSRAMTLADNTRKWGTGNIVVTNNDPAHFKEFRDWFDIIAVDAPCSGEGMFRKDPKAKDEWNPDLVNLCASRQRRILSDIWGALKPEGILIYSTCTYNRQENEENIKWLCSEFDCESVELSVPGSWNIVQGEVIIGNIHIPTFRFYPHMTEGEGFFVAVIRKSGQTTRPSQPKTRRNVLTDIPKHTAGEMSSWIRHPELMHYAQGGDNAYAYYDGVFADIKTVIGTLSVVTSGVAMGQLINGKLKPDHSLALFHDVDKDNVTTAELPLEEALNYLRKQNVDPQYFNEGINLTTYSGHPIGWAKKIGPRINNMYPKELRILHL